MSVRRYWEPSFEPDGSHRWRTGRPEIQHKMAESVAAHKISDVEVGSFLSSGVDSSYMAHLAHVDKTFTVGFADKQYDETDYAAGFSKFWGWKTTPTALSRRSIGRTCPRSSTTWTNPWPTRPAWRCICEPGGRKAGEGVPFGRGADEFFGGYNIYKEPFTVSWYDNGCPRRCARGAGRQAAPGVGRELLVRRAKPLEERYIGNTNLLGGAAEEKACSATPGG